MPDEQPQEPEKPLDDSSDIEVMDAQARSMAAEAKLKKAEAELAKAKTPLVDKLIVRGLIPIALAIVGPWALWKFDADQAETKAEVEAVAKAQAEQGKLVGSLQRLLDDAKKYRDDSSKREAAWRGRMKKLEEKKATEIAVLAAMVIKLDEALKMSLLWQALDRAVRQDVSLFERPAVRPKSGGRKAGSSRPRVSLDKLRARRDKLIAQTVRQVQPQDQNQERAKEMAKRVFERYVQDQEQQQAQQE